MVVQEPNAGFIDVDLSVAALKRSIGTVLLGLLAGVILAAAFAFAQPNSHRSWATVLVKPIGVDLSRVGNADVDSVAERELGGSFIVAERAASKVGIDTTDVAEVRTLRRGVSVRRVDQRPILEFSYADTDAERARDIAAAVAESYLEIRSEQAEVSIENAANALATREAEIRAQLNEVELALADAAVDSAEFRAGINTQGVLISQLTAIGSDVARVGSLTRDPGQIISPAQISQSSARTRLVPIMIAGAMLGALLGLLFALFRDRSQRREQLETDELERLGVPPVGYMPRAVGGADAAASLRRSVASTLAGSDAKVVAVTTVSGDGPPSFVANWLAQSLGSDHRVLLISADFDSRSLSRQLGLGATPGLLDALIERQSISDVRQEHGGIHVVGAGQSERDPESVIRLIGLSGFLDSGRADYDYVIIAAPSLLDSATASFASFAADGTLLVVDQGDNRVTVEQAVSVLRRAGSEVLGSIVLTDSGVAEVR